MVDHPNQRTEDTIVEFFLDPQTPPSQLGRYSTLYLLRRDMDACMGFNPETRLPSHGTGKAIWPGVMAAFAGMDLLGKFYLGDTADSGGVGCRFKKYVEWFVLNPKETVAADSIYGLRNALMHSFGLYEKRRDGTEIRYSLAETGANLLSVTEGSSPQNHRFNVHLIRTRFETSLPRFRDWLMDHSNPQWSNLPTLFNRYGFIGVQPDSTT